MKSFVLIFSAAIILGVAFGLYQRVSSCPISGALGASSAETFVPVNPNRGTAIGNLAPDFNLPGTAGGSVSFDSLKGAPAVVVFWTAWCPICKEEAPMINELDAEFRSKGVKTIGINIGESDARIAEGIKDFGIKYTVLKDKDGSVARAYNVIGTPTIVILDRNGSVTHFGNKLPDDYAAMLSGFLTQ